jgi:predicted HD superfamily hydrolase involved in NAD metabolism
VIDEKELAERLRKTLKKARFEHTKGVVKTAAALAKRHGVDPARARLAAWLHDCAKSLERDAMVPLLRLAELDKEERSLPPLWHAPLGAYLARRDFGVRDAEVLQAIRRHSTGAPGQTPLQKVLFVADYIEPGRPAWPELPALRLLARKDLDAAWERTLAHKLMDLLQRGRPLHPMSLAAYHHALQSRNDA